MNNIYTVVIEREMMSYLTLEIAAVNGEHALKLAAEQAAEEDYDNWYHDMKSEHLNITAECEE